MVRLSLSPFQNRDKLHTSLANKNVKQHYLSSDMRFQNYLKLSSQKQNDPLRSNTTFDNFTSIQLLREPLSMIDQSRDELIEY